MKEPTEPTFFGLTAAEYLKAISDAEDPTAVAGFMPKRNENARVYGPPDVLRRRAEAARRGQIPDSLVPDDDDDQLAPFVEDDDFDPRDNVPDPIYGPPEDM